MVVVALARLEAAWSVYERVYLPSRATRTHRGYRSAVRRFLAELPDPFGLPELVLWRGRMVEERRLSLSYVNQAIKILRGITRRASHVTGDVELASMFAQVETLKEPTRAPRCPPADYVARILGAARNPAERAFMLLTSLAGLRRDEVLGLRVSDWDPSARVLQVVRQRQRCTRKNGRPHAVTVNTHELAWCLDWTVTHHVEIIPAQGRWPRSSAAYLFPWSHTYVEHMVGRIRRHLGADVDRYMPPGTALHAGRHWGTTELARRGVPLFEIQAWRGDAEPGMTATYVAMVRGMTSGSVGVLADRWRHHARRAKVTRCTATTPCTGRHRHAGDGPSRSRGSAQPKGHHPDGVHHHGRKHSPQTPPGDDAPREHED